MSPEEIQEEAKDMTLSQLEERVRICPSYEHEWWHGELTRARESVMQVERMVDNIDKSHAG